MVWKITVNHQLNMYEDNSIVVFSSQFGGNLVIIIITYFFCFKVVFCLHYYYITKKSASADIKFKYILNTFCFLLILLSIAKCITMCINVYCIVWNSFRRYSLCFLKKKNFSSTVKIKWSLRIFVLYVLKSM